MLFIQTFFEAVRDFVELGGDILFYIAIVIFFMWLAITERIIYFTGEHKTLMKNALNRWEARSEHRSWNAHAIREMLVSQVNVAASTNLSFIKALVALCPLLGLLGTVTGMIEVFDVMAVSGTGNARSMASGVAKATVPTMAGMVGALTGVFAISFLDSKARREVELLGDRMALD